MSAYLEHKLQTTCAVFLARALPPDVAWTSVDPATDQKMTMVAGARRKARGIKPGWSDLQFIRLGQFYAIELKIPGGRQSENQRLRQTEIESAGAQYAICYSVEDVEQRLLSWGFVLRATSFPAAEYDARREARQAAPKKRTSKPRSEASNRAALNVLARARAKGVFV
jgi:hypothetical protein